MKLTLSFLCSICGLRLLNNWISPLADIITSENEGSVHHVNMNTDFNTITKT